MKRLSALLGLLLALSLALPARAEDMPVIEWQTPAPTSTPTPDPRDLYNTFGEGDIVEPAFGHVEVGDSLTFGRYEQDGDSSNGPEDIEWIVLETDGEYATLISKYGLDCQPYNEAFADVTWSDCTLRTWLNDIFLNEAFTASEQLSLQPVTLSNPDNPGYGTLGGPDTTDRIFLLSIQEADEYFDSNWARECIPTEVVMRAGIPTTDGACLWWLRSPGNHQSYAAYVKGYGDISSFGNMVYPGYEAVRPVVLLKL